MSVFKPAHPRNIIFSIIFMEEETHKGKSAEDPGRHNVVQGLEEEEEREREGRRENV